MLEVIGFTLREAANSSRLLLGFYICFQILLSLLVFLNTFTLKEIIDAATNQNTILGLSLISILLLRFVIEISARVLKGTTQYVWAILKAQNVIHLNQKFIDKVATLDLATLENSNRVDHISRAFGKLNHFNFYLASIIESCTALIEIVFTTFIFLMVSPIAGLLIVTANLIPIWAQARTAYSIFLIYKADSETKRRFGYLTNMITDRKTLPEIKVNQAFSYFKKRLVNIYSTYVKNQLDIEKKYQILVSLSEMLPIFSVFVFTLTISLQLSRGTISTGWFAFLFSSVLTFASALNRLGDNIGFLQTDSHVMHDAMEFFNLKPFVIFPSLSNKSATTLSEELQRPTIVIENLSFKYPNAKKPAIRHINLEIPFGQKIAIVGENGAGKTTLIKLLMRIYDPHNGNIYLNGINLKEIPENILYPIYATLFQEFGQFYLTIKENLELATGAKLTSPEIIKLLSQSNAWNYVQNFEEQYNQQLGPEYSNGIDLSVGQWQQLGIARTMAKNGQIIILDEPTSAIDAKSEVEIFDKLLTQLKQQTMIYISHRFSTIKDAERIVVLHKGEIIEDGSHTELIQQQGRYANLYTLQAARYDR